MAKIWSTFLVTILVALGAAYPSGPPESDLVCLSMRPYAGSDGGHGADAQNDTAPILIDVANKHVVVGGSLDVWVASTSGTPFKGVLLMARVYGLANDSQARPLGYFNLTDGLRDACNSSAYSAAYGGKGVSHARPLDRTAQQFTWYAKNVTANTIVQFYATVVQVKSVYWVKIPGPAVMVVAQDLRIPHTKTVVQPPQDKSAKERSS